LPDCSECHSLKGFNNFTYTFEQHNQGPFPLKGAHLAVPCNECHRKKDNWSFREIGINCKDCHKDIHKDHIQEKYYPSSECKTCHKEENWHEISFDHSLTAFQLTGAHKKISCGRCHILNEDGGTFIQKFKGLGKYCVVCHKDNHSGQFARNGSTVCEECHETESWKATRFDHDKTQFRLDGKHINVPCYKCHKPQNDGINTYILYKIKDFRCESCHS
jgi:hypothetical protein